MVILTGLKFCAFQQDWCKYNYHIITLVKKREFSISEIVARVLSGRQQSGLQEDDKLNT